MCWMEFVHVLGLALLVFGRACAWTAGSTRGVSVTVDESFGYAVSVDGTPWLEGGNVAVHCDGKHYRSAPNASEHSLTLIEPPTALNDSDTRLGKYVAFTATWAAGRCCELTTEVRYYSDVDAFEFVTTMGADGAEGTNTNPPDTRLHGPFPIAVYLATEFPAFLMPSPSRNLGYITWSGVTLYGSWFQMHRPAENANMSKTFVGGLLGGPLILYDATHNAVVLAPSSQFEVGRLSGLDSRLAGGVQGIVARVPGHYTLRFMLSGGNRGVTAAMTTWGQTLQQASHTRKMTLSDDQLSRQLHFVDDNGSNYNYCMWWPGCQKDNNCVPMHVTLSQLKAYHDSLDLAVGLYHLDPWWWSQHPYGGCEDGAISRNLSASPFHFPGGMSKVGLPLQIIVVFINTTNNVYLDKWEFDGRGNAGQVVGPQAYAFYRELFSYHTTHSNVRALVWDSVHAVFLDADARVNNTETQQQWHSGFANAAFDYGLPIRVDQSQPSDTLGSVLYPAYTVGRCTPDAGPTSMMFNWWRLAANALFLSSVGVRPMMDVMWTTSHQPSSPYHIDRPHVEHDIITAVLSTGPVGIGDMINATNATLLSSALRKDGTILKPVRAALRLDRYYSDVDGPCEIHAAPSSPAAHPSSRLDKRADSRAVFSGDEEMWWWVMFATNVTLAEGGNAVRLGELWPSPPKDVTYLVHDWNSFPCMHGSSASSCVEVWNATSPLDVRSSEGGDMPSRLRRAAPVLPTGWVLMGELSKIVPVSPQRFFLLDGAARDVAPSPDDFRGTSADFEVLVIGSKGEFMSVTLVTPSKAVHVSEFSLKNEGCAKITCSGESCVVTDVVCP